MLFDDFLPLLVGGLGILVIHADVVGAERAMIIGVGLGIWDRIEFPEDVSGTHEQSSQKQFVLHGIIIRRLGKRDAIRLNLGQAEAKIVRLHLPVPRTLLSGRLVADPGKQATGRVSLNDEWIDLAFELMRTGVLSLHAAQSLSVLGIGFPSDEVGNADAAIKSPS